MKIRHLKHGLWLLPAAVLFIVGSVWIEDRHPSDDPRRALAPGAQRLVTKPIVTALSHQLESFIRNRTEARFSNTNLTLDETIAWFLDERVDLRERRFHAFRLAYAGTPAAAAALWKVLATAPPEHKAYMIQLIGNTGNPAGKGWLLPMLDDPSELVVRAALRGLGAMGGDDVTAQIASLLADPQRSANIQAEAARSLGAIGTATTRAALVETLERGTGTEVATAILTSLGQFPFSMVAVDFQTYLAAPTTPHALRVVAAEALAYSTADAVPFLVTVAAGNGDAELRAAAAWAISVHPDDAALGTTLAGLAEQEPEADVRRRLYEAQLPQSNIPGDRLWPTVQAETDIAARVAGLNALGRAVNQQPTSATAAIFDREIVPELVAIATQPNSLNIQMRAVFALRRAETPAAQAALESIASRAVPQVAAAARHGLRTPNS